MYGFNIHACLDLGSSFAVYAAIELDDKPDVLLSTFERAITAFGYPMAVHTKLLDGAQAICDKIEQQCEHDSFITQHCKSGWLCVRGSA